MDEQGPPGRLRRRPRPPDADSGRGEEPLSTSLGVSGPAARGPFSDGGHSIRTFRARFGRTRFDRTPGPAPRLSASPAGTAAGAGLSR